MASSSSSSLYRNSRYLIIFLLLAVILTFVYTEKIPQVTKVAVRGLPLLGVSGRDVLRLECAASGNPIPTLHWTFNDTKVVSNMVKYRLVNNNAQLIVSKTTLRDSGVYRCFASNSLGSVFGQKAVEIPSLGQFNDGYKALDDTLEIQATIGEALSIPCPPHQEGLGQIYLWGDLPAHSTPIFWKAGEPVERAFIGKHGTLSFAYLTEGDIKKVNDLGGISCMLYQDQHAVQGVRYKIKARDTESTTDFPPEMIAHMDADFTLVEGKRSSILCGAKGRPQPKFMWYKDDVLIYNGTSGEVLQNDIRVTGEGMELSFDPVLLDSEGEYRCVASNKLGNDERKGKLTVHSSPKWNLKLPEKEVVLVEDKLSLKCEATAVPEVLYSWYFNGSLVVNNDRQHVMKNVLTVNKTDFADSGVYMCVALNYLEATVSATYVLVDAVTPEFTKKFQPLEYFFKDYVTPFHCDVTSRPPPIRTWYRNGTVIENNERFTVFSNGTLLVTNPIMDDVTTYKCVGVNVKGTAESSFKTKVVERTIITKPPADIESPEGTPLTQIFCDATYETTQSFTVEFKWSKDGKPIEFDDRVTKERRVTGPSRIITIRDLQVSDAGFYGCLVENKDNGQIVTSDEKKGNLKVRAKPDAPFSLQINGSCTSNDGAVLSWQKPMEHVAPIHGYTIEYASFNSQTWYTFKEEITETKVELNKDNLAPSRNLIFRVKAVGIYNSMPLVSEASEHTGSDLCVTGLGPPVKNPNNVRSERNENGKLKIIWDQTNEIDQSSSYEVIIGYRKPGENNFTLITVTSDSHSVEIPDSDGGQGYEVYVQSKNENGLGPKAEVLSLGGNAITSAVENVQLDSISSTGVQISWQDVDTATGYRIYYWKDTSINRRRRRNSDSRSYVDVKSVNKASVIGLDADIAYKLSISAMNLDGEGPESQEIKFSTKVGVPDAPTNVVIHTYGNALKLTWDPPKNNKDITSYTLRYYKTDESPPTVKTITVAADAQEAFITKDLDVLSYYTVELVPNTDHGEGKAWKMEGIVVSLSDKPGRPGKPLVQQFNTSVLNITFVLPPDYYGGLPKSFNVYYKVDGTSHLMAENQSYPEASWLTLHDLRPSVMYEIYTTGANDLAEGVASEIALATTPSVVPMTHDEAQPFYTKLWFIILIVCIVILILFVLITYCYCNKCSGGKYKVDEKEKHSGGWSDNEPLKDHSEIPMDDMFNDTSPILTKTNGEPIRSVSQNSLNKPPPYKDAVLLPDNDGDNDDDDNDSLDDYGEDMKFNEDGSFIGQYGDEEKRKLKV